MQFNVAQLLKEPVGAVRRYQLKEDISELDSELDVLGLLLGTVQIMRTNSGVLVTGELSTAVRVNCGRCIEPIVYPLRMQLEESFRPLTEVETGRYLRPEEFEGDSADFEDDALVIDEHHLLDLTEVVRQNIWLAVPMYPSCNWAGEGECPNLATQREALRHLSATDEDEEQVDALPEGVDPRWAALLKLRLDTKDENSK
ncbi:MAG: DUF177 domain-containing protein [Caldilineaceae bacterium]|nr:DUF177 domain-containing protein [Caldilineaceae bacterium]